MQPQLRAALFTAIVAVGIAAVGGVGYAMTYVGSVIDGVTHITIVHTRSSVRTVVVNAANDQYGTTTTQTTTATTTTSTVAAVSTSGDGTKTATVPQSSAGTVTVAPPTDGSAPTQVTWSSTTFATPVTVTIDPTPPIAAPAFAGPASDQIVSIVVTNPATGQVIHQLSAPLEIVFPNAPKGYVPAFSEDGVNFQALTEISGPPLPDSQQDGYYVASDGSIHILTRHLTQFAVLYKANYSQSESGRKTAPAGSGKFGDPTRMHTGAPNVDVLKPTLSGESVSFSFFVDEQAAVYFHVISNGKQLVISPSSTVRKSPVGGTGHTTLHVVILRPGTIATTLHVPGVKAGSKVQVTFVDYDGHKVTKTLTVG
jgi:hypothetical protein